MRGRVAWMVIQSMLWTACSEGAGDPPPRDQRLGAPRWIDARVAQGAAEVPDALTAAPSPTPEPLVTPTYKGVMAVAVETWGQTSHQQRRRRAVEVAVSQLTEQDLQEVMKALASARRPDSEVAMAILTLHHTRSAQWKALEDAFRVLFRAVPALAADPSYLLEHAVALLRTEQYDEALARAAEAEKHFRLLPGGQPTLAHRARMWEVRAWASEAQARRAESRGEGDAQVLELDTRALRAWQTYISLLEAQADTSPAGADALRVSRDHLQYLQESLDLARGEGR